MNRLQNGAWLAAAAILSLAALTGVGRAADKLDRNVSLAGGKLKLTAPESWTPKKPQNNVIEYEFAVPAVKPDETDGRVTVTGAGGSVDANVDRWIGQFAQPDGSNSKDRAKIRQQKIAGQEVSLVDLSGTYSDTRGPFSGTPAVERPNYRLLAAIVVTKDLGNYFIKFYGPERTVAENAKAFEKMVDSLERK